MKFTDVRSPLGLVRAYLVRRAAMRALEDDRRIREMLVGREFAKRHAAAKRGKAA